VEALPDLTEFFQQSEEIVRNYEREVSSLPAIPERLLSDVREIGILFNGPTTRSDTLSEMSLGDTVQKFRDYYTSIKNLRGEEELRKTLSLEKELAQRLDKDERGLFLDLIDQMESELLP
jgi:hypothetical protein